MWMVNPRGMCRQHLLGEHLETHMLRGTMAAGGSVAGYLQRGLLAPARLASRHEELVAEMERRGMQHRSPLAPLSRIWAGLSPEEWTRGIDAEWARAELLRRCPRCRAMFSQLVEGE